jgi:hypothetical protein
MCLVKQFFLSNIFKKGDEGTDLFFHPFTTSFSFVTHIAPPKYDIFSPPAQPSILLFHRQKPCRIRTPAPARLCPIPSSGNRHTGTLLSPYIFHFFHVPLAETAKDRMQAFS